MITAPGNQPIDAGLNSISGLTTSANKMVYTTGSDTYAVTDITAAGRAILDDADASAQRTTLGLGTISTQAANSVSISGGAVTGITDITVADGGTGASNASGARANLGLEIGSRVQAFDADLGAIAALTSAADKGIQFIGSGKASLYDLTAAGKALLDDADASAQRTTLGLGTISTQAANSVSISGGAVTGITDITVADGGTGASNASGARTNLGLGAAALLATNTGAAHTPTDTILWLDTSTTPHSLRISTRGNVCFLKGTKITLPDNSQKNIEDLTLDDEVLTYNIEGLSDIRNKGLVAKWQSGEMKGELSKSGIRNIWINPTDSYLVINEKLRVTNHHLIHFRRDNIYFFNFAEELKEGDELLTDQGKYEKIESIDSIFSYLP